MIRAIAILFAWIMAAGWFGCYLHVMPLPIAIGVGAVSAISLGFVASATTRDRWIP